MDNRLIPLEDTWLDVLRKACHGLHLTEVSLASRAGITAGEAARLLGGELDPSSLRKAARVLGLDPASLLALARGAYHPGEIALPKGMALFTSDWDSMKVHSYLAWDEATREAAAFDTGADATDLLAFLREHDLTLRLLLLTHGHGDHVFEADRILEKTGAEAWIGEAEGVPGIAAFAPGKEFRLGSLTIATRLTKGHAPGGITYVIGGLDRPVAVVGDALFAGSMGGANTSYADCLRTNAGEILSLPPETILCPGHGPLTTVALERGHNPFFAHGAPGLPKKIVLASSSPRRRDLLNEAGFDVDIRPADIDELTDGLAPRDLVAANAERKARHVAAKLRGDLVLGADTVVVLDGEILGKPRDRGHAAEMLGRLSGRVHEVLTGVCLIRGGSRERCLFVESTRVSFRKLDAALIEAYLTDIDPLDKAGSYAAQDDQGRLIERIEGSLENVIGLPVARVMAALRQHFTEEGEG